MTTLYKKTYFSLILIFSITIGYGQYGESIRSGRPGQAIGPFTVGAKVFQVQAGTDFSGSKETSVGETNSNATDIGSVFRMGFTEHFEVGLGINYNNQRTEFGTQKTSMSGLSSFSIRVRSNVYVGKGAIPTIGYQFNLGIPTVSEAYKANNVAPKITFMTGQQFGERWGFTTNWGANWDGNTPGPSGFNILNLGYGLSDKISLFIEQYGSWKDGKYDGKLDGGFAYLVNNDLQLDLHGGQDKNGSDYTEWFVSVGVSWRVRFQKQATTD